MKILITGMLFIVIETSIVYSVTPYNERCDDFTAQFSANLSQSNDCFIFQYSLDYMLINTLDFILLNISYNRETGNKVSFVKLYGKASDNREWSGSIIIGDSGANLMFSPMRRSGDTLKTKTIMKDGHPFIYQTGTAYLKPGQSLTVYYVVKQNIMIPGCGNVDGEEVGVYWLTCEGEEPGPSTSEGTEPKHFPTIIPMPRPTSAVEYATYLMEQTTTAKNLGMISSIDTYSVLWNRTMMIRSKTLEGPKSYNIAIAELEQYRIQLAGQRSKTVNEDAFQVLDYVASEMIRLMK